MFESAELNHKIDKKKYDKEVPKLRESLLDVQLQLAKNTPFQVIVIIGGVDGAGKGETVNLLNEWMDPRYIQTHSYGPMSEEEQDRPAMWRFWRDLPPRGRIGLFFGSWYTNPIVDHVLGRTKKGEYQSQLDEINRFEHMLTNEGALVLKFWMHLSKEDQRKRLKSLEKNPLTKWRVTTEDWKRFKSYDKFKKHSEFALRHTNSSHAPWNIVEGSDENYRYLTIGKIILSAIEARLKEKKSTNTKGMPTFKSMDNKNIIDSLNLTQKLSKDTYKKELEKYQGKLNLLSRHPKFHKLSVLALFEGNDAAGKGGGIRRVTSALDARYYGIIPVAAPTEEEKRQPYLWRFWRHLPRHGRFTIFDRSWYGRVLVERVEGFCSEKDWQRAYSEITDFEEQLVKNNTVVLKFWLATSKEEQLKRFKDREKTSYKNFKITEDDWRNRKKWNEYKTAVCDMIDKTSTRNSSWTLIESEDKYFGRIKILKTFCDAIEKALKKV
jgi:polyphosphate:AMP phosphotransferase